ncbi:uncharacterized protein PFL1_01324 [Pseudozyma flocculosa PF-1]|uniref:Mid2 domain-containing protein n=1 Tax=Pseudozyma flocculosa TaxID=84751 RepID=A0A5C3EY00_9BASI|nr:uncharacterized protein PFL1_01324 [Pseudozyma flocculosa PF-1]EPQ31135.1 hypothetical protein PFL1_01324 [Pseudozyma flocculosa PF-1]SPO35999.1 uncharacterized protein PSFLO_01470 [Pseudozyma flocculosa]
MKSVRTLALAVLLSFATAQAAQHHQNHHQHLVNRDTHVLLPRLLGGVNDPSSASETSDSSTSQSSSTSDSSEDVTSTSRAAAATTTSAAAASSSSAAAASSSSASRASASASSVAAAASSSVAAAASKSASAAQESQSSAAAASSSSASLASASSASLASASSAAAAAASSSTVFLTQTVAAPTADPTSSSDAAAASQTASSDSSSGGVSTGLIIGISVAGGVLILAALVFLYMKFGGKRFDGLDDNDTDIKWPELKQDPDSAAMQPLPARRTGGAGFDMGEDSDNGHDGGYGSSLKGRDSFTGSTTALAAAAPGYPVNDAHYAAGGMDAGYMAHQPAMQPGQFYDMYPQNTGGSMAGDAQGGYHGGYNDSAMQQQYSDAHHAQAGYPNNAGYPDGANPYGADPYSQAHAHVNMQPQQGGQYH